MKNMKLLTILLGSLFIQNTAQATDRVYFVSTNGSNYNNGLSQLTAFKSSPGMASCTGNCKKVDLMPGDKVVFRGGDVWATRNFPLEVKYSGTAAKKISFGSDLSWFSGSSFKKPIFDMKLRFPRNVPSSVIVLKNVEHIVMTGFEIKNLLIEKATLNAEGEPIRRSFTSSVEIIGPSGTQFMDGIRISNFYIHDWKINNFKDVDDGRVGGIIFRGNLSNLTISGNHITNPDTTSAKENLDRKYGMAIAGLGKNMKNLRIIRNLIHDVNNAIVTSAGKIVGNRVYDITKGLGYPRTHSNAIQIFAGLDEAIVANNYVYDNDSGRSIGTCPPAKVFNNVAFDTRSTPIEILTNPSVCGDTSAKEAYVFNNTLSPRDYKKPADYDGYAFRLAAVGDINRNQKINKLFFKNNLLITNNMQKAACFDGASKNCEFAEIHESGNNITLDRAEAVRLGFLQRNLMNSKITVFHEGENLSTLCNQAELKLCLVNINYKPKSNKLNESWNVGAY